jgi:hypothetical protein
LGVKQIKLGRNGMSKDINTKKKMQVGRLIGKKLAREKKFKILCMKRGPTTPKKQLETFQINLLNLRDLNA